MGTMGPEELEHTVHLGELTVDDVRSRFVEIYTDALANPEEDQGIGAHAVAMSELLASPSIRSEYQEALNYRRQMDKPTLLGSEVKHDFRAAHNAVFGLFLDTASLPSITDPQERLATGISKIRQLGTDEYFDFVYDPENWINLLADVYENRNRRGPYFFDRVVRNNQRTDTRREASALLAGKFLEIISGGDREFSKADIGSGAGLGLVQEAIGDRFDPIKVVELETDQLGEVHGQNELTFATNALSGLLRVQANFERSVGIEAMEIDKDIETAMWVASNSFNPAELSPDLPLKDNFIDLWLKKLDSDVEFITATFGNDEHFLQLPVASEKFNMITFFTVLHQHLPEVRKSMLDQAIRMLDEVGVLLVQDFAIPDPSNPHELIFLDNWGHWQYRTLLYQKEQGWQEIFRWYDGTCKQVALGEGSIKVGLHEMSPKRWIKAMRRKYTHAAKYTNSL